MEKSKRLSETDWSFRKNVGVLQITSYELQVKIEVPYIFLLIDKSK